MSQAVLTTVRFAAAVGRPGSWADPDDGDLEPLSAQGHRAQWRETIIMAAGHAIAPQREELMTGLLSRIAEEPRYARRLKLLVTGSEAWTRNCFVQ